MPIRALFFILIYPLFTPFDPLLFIYLILDINQGLFRGIVTFDELTTFGKLTEFGELTTFGELTNLPTLCPIYRYCGRFTDSMLIYNVSGFCREFSYSDPRISDSGIDFYP